jgi:hypothetical protein
MHNDDGRVSETTARDSKLIGFGRLAYDPIDKIWWFYGIGKATDQGGTYTGPTNFGSSGLETFVHLLKSSLEFSADDIQRIAQERLDDKAER